MILDQDVLYNYALSFLGKPYLWGGDDPMAGFDCSGLCVELLKSCGILSPKSDLTAQDLYELFPKAETMPFTEIDFGDLVYFGSPSKVTHVGFCLTDNLMMEAGGGDSTTISEAVAIKMNAFIRIRPIKSRKDIVGYNHPPYAWKA